MVFYKESKDCFKVKNKLWQKLKKYLNKIFASGDMIDGELSEKDSNRNLNLLSQFI